MNALGTPRQAIANADVVDQLTQRIIGCAHAVSNTLGTGFVEKVYENALAHQMRKEGLTVLQQYPVRVAYDDVIVGEFYADALVNDTVVVELKAASALTADHVAQALNYLRATGLPACLLINFGLPKLQIRRLHPSPNWKSLQR